MEETLETFGLRMAMWVTSDEAKQLYRLIVSEATQFPKLGLALWQHGPESGRRALRDYLDLLVEPGRLDIPDTDVAALQFQGMLVGMPQVRLSLNLPSALETNAKLKAWYDKASRPLYAAIVLHRSRLAGG